MKSEENIISDDDVDLLEQHKMILEAKVLK